MVAVKRAHNKLIFRGIRKSLNRFLSILGIVALGAGFLSGLVVTTPDMKAMADQYYDESRMYDLDIKGTLGITEEDAEALSQQESIDTVMPAYVTDILVEDQNQESYVARIFGVLGEEEPALNCVTLLEGRMPKNKNECVIEVPNSYSSPHQVGEVYTISSENQNYDSIGDTFAQTEFTVVGIVRSPTFISIQSETSTVGSGSVDIGLYVYQDCFSLDVYTDLFAIVAGSQELDTFSDDYKDLVANTSESLKSFGEERSQARYDQLVGDATEELNDAREEYETQRADAEQELEEAYQVIQDGKAEIEDGKTQLVSANATLASQRQEIENGWTQLEAGEAELNQTLARLEEVRPAIEALKQQQAAGVELPEEYLQQIALYDAGVAQANQAQATLESQREQLTEAEATIQAAQQELDQRQSELDSAEQELADAEQEYQEQYANAQAEFADAEQELADAQADIDAIEVPEWYFFERTDNAGFTSFEDNADKVAAVAKVFPVFFFLVAALVALTTMTRMVEEERTQIGTLKALGYRNSTILRYYLIYSGSASVLGCVIGLLIGFQLLPKVISNAYSMLFNLPEMATPFSWPIAGIVAPVTIGCVMLTTYLACKNELKERPASLIIPRAPKAGKRILLERIGFLWKRLSFTYKVTARNLFRYKKRFFMTIIGVAGCSALLVTGFGIRDSINNIVDKQFSEIYQYQLTLQVNDADACQTDETLANVLNDKTIIEDYLQLSSESVTLVNGKNQGQATLEVPKETDKLKSFIRMQDRITQADVAFDARSVVLTEKLAEELNIQAGDTVELEDADGKSYSITITGITENYVTSFLYVGSDIYEEIFGTAPEYTSVLAKVNEGTTLSNDEISARILRSDEVLFSMFSDTIQESFANSVQSIDYIVVVLIIAAGLLSIIVLYNLTNVNIGERTKELATIKVLGFYDREVQAYIFRETNILSLIGTLVGLVVGIWLHAFIVHTIEMDSIMFGRNIEPLSFILATVISIAFTLLVNLIMRKRIRSIDMVESMKAND